MYLGPEFSNYFNNCGEANCRKFPVLKVVIGQRSADGLIQDHFDFLRTDAGYRLVSLTIRQEELKYILTKVA